MSKNALLSQAAIETHDHYSALTSRVRPFSEHPEEIRSPFMRDYTKILHSLAYRRLKHKTQVFFNVSNDHICTRIEHVSHVDSVSSIIAAYLGLNTELTRAIAIGHDLGHAPFGHQGEFILKKFSKKHFGKNFWHEQNGLRFVDHIELLENSRLQCKNLNLTYAVRDGIICHCGEIDENQLFPRKELMDLSQITSPGEVQPATWEGCVVKLSDKISYLGRDIADAITLGLLGDKELAVLSRVANFHGAEAINTTVIINEMIMDVCQHSSIEKGITMSPEHMALLNDIKKYNYEYIYENQRLAPFRRYADLILTEIFNALYERYDGKNTICALEQESHIYPLLMGEFAHWLGKYSTLDFSAFSWGERMETRYVNEKIYGDLTDEKVYVQAILDYLSGMTDGYAIRVFEELISV